MNNRYLNYVINATKLHIIVGYCNMTEENTDDVQQNSNEEVKTEKRNLRQEILALMIKQEVCSSRNIIDGCELGDKGRNSYSYVWRPINYLKNKGYIEKKKFGRNNPDKRKGPCHSIKRDLAIISKIYHDPEFEELKPRFRSSDWVRYLIIQEHLATTDNSMKDNFHMMLGWSEKFFDLCLTHNMADKGVFIWKAFFNDLIGFASGKEADPLIIVNYLQKNALYDIFLACMMREYVDDFINNKLTGTTVELALNELVKQNNATKRQIFAHNTSVIAMNILLAIVKGCQTNNYRLPDPLVRKINTYEQMMDRYMRNELPDLTFQHKRDVLFNNIIKDLDFSFTKGNIPPGPKFFSPV